MKLESVRVMRRTGSGVEGWWVKRRDSGFDGKEIVERGPLNLKGMAVVEGL